MYTSDISFPHKQAFLCLLFLWLLKGRSSFPLCEQEGLLLHDVNLSWRWHPAYIQLPFVNWKATVASTNFRIVPTLAHGQSLRPYLGHIDCALAQNGEFPQNLANQHHAHTPRPPCGHIVVYQLKEVRPAPPSAMSFCHFQKAQLRTCLSVTIPAWSIPQNLTSPCQSMLPGLA